MLKLPKGLKKKKKGKKSKRKGEDELFTEEELEKYRREHQQQQEGEGAKENEEWSKFKDLTTGVDSVLKRTQGDLDRIKSTSFFQRVVKKEPEPPPKVEPSRPVVEVTEADFPQLVAAAAAAAAADEEPSSCGVTDDESEEEEEDDIFDTSYVDAVERGEVKLGYVSDSPTEAQDDDIFDTSHVDALIRGQETKSSKGNKQALDIGLAVGVLTGRIDNVTLAPTRRSKRVIPGDLLLESADQESVPASTPKVAQSEPVETSILDTDADLPITTPIDLSVSLHTALLQQSRRNSQEDLSLREATPEPKEEEEIDEFTLLAAESLETSAAAIKLEEKEIQLEPVLQESWSAFEADKSDTVFAESIVEDQIDVIDPYIDQDDPFDTSFADAVVPVSQQQVKKEAVILEEDDDFDPRAEEFQARLNNRRKSSVRIHLTNPSGIRESITSDEIALDKEEESKNTRDLLGGSSTDLTQLVDSPLDPLDINETEIDPFDTTIVDKICAPGKVELKLLERELIGSTPVAAPVYRVPSDPDFDPRAEEPTTVERRASRPENLIVNKSVIFNVEGDSSVDLDVKGKPTKPVTPYYTRDLSITEDPNEESEAADVIPDGLTRTRSDEDLAPKPSYQTKRRHSEFPAGSRVTTSDLLHGAPTNLPGKVLSPCAPPRPPAPKVESDPFDTSFAGDIAPSKTELRLLAKEFSCEETSPASVSGEPDFLEPAEDSIFQAKALTPEPSNSGRIPDEDYDPFDTSFAGDLNPGRTELKLLESEFLN
ncbi:protein stoned-A [Phthorimaea operculella]|nr:protein stoned-A [Phthorimaea operculella]